ncbi:MAG: TM0106 family RecB-like putative nuclease [Elusimicrobiota bacterium]|jgi:uncharacterized protein|nr:TM0106 family RecB-like putative nuclease [Elusimicrobiota bacterium]
MPITEEIFYKMSAGRTPDAGDFHAGKMYLLLQDPFGLWCNYHAPQEEAVEEPNLYENMRGRADRGNRDAWIHEYCRTTIIIRGADDDAKRFKNTLDAMAEGIEGIIGACLWDLRGQRGVWGTVNLLLKVNNGVSLFGDYHYKIVQLKRAGDLKEHYAVQTALMDMILTEVQSAKAANALFVLRSKEQSLDTDRFKERVRTCIEDWAAIKAGALVPEAKKPPKAAHAPWRVYANKYVFKHKDLVLLPHLSAAQRGLLRAAGLINYEDVLDAGLAKIKEILADPQNPADVLAAEIYSTAAAYRAQKPVARSREFWPPAVAARNLYFDFEATETFTGDTISFVYLIGLWDKEGGKFVSFIAKSEADEQSIFKQFADYIGDGADANLYHWTEYEVKKMQKLREKYPAIKADLEKLLSRCVDLKIVVEKSFYLPSPSLSLKAVAPAFGFRWRQTDCGAMDSMVYFTKWLAGGPQELMDKVLMYNEDDCRAMLFIEDYLNSHEVLEPVV